MNSFGEMYFQARLRGAAIPESSLTLWTESSSQLSLIARTYTQAPSTPLGVRFEDFNDSVINDVGKTVLRARVGGTGVTDGGEYGIWSDASGILSLVAREGDQAPDMPSGVAFDSFYSLHETRLSITPLR